MERYQSLGPVGEGSYGTVLKCRHRHSGRLVAIKKFTDSDDDKTVKKIALREIKLLRQLRHDNLVNLLEVWRRRRRWYLVFEFVERTLLDELEGNPSGLEPTTSRQYLYQILRAAAFCHEQHIIHRDIKPENILISQGGVVKLCDFGFARTMTSPAEGGVYTDYVATRWYRAPELLVGDTKYGKPVDVWAIGCLLIEMLTGQPLFPGDSDLDQIYHIVRCFGNLTAHHQELFYRNPVFSGVRLPECSDRVTLEQRFPTITAVTLDLAQSCLQMDPDRRAQCSDLLEHRLFTQDSFHIRVLDELNAKIQKDHRENSTLPKLVKTSRREKDTRDDRNGKGKDKKPSECVIEKVSKEKEKTDKEGGEEKVPKTKGKQPSKPPKNTWRTSEHLVSSKQSKTSGLKVTDNAAKAAVAVRSKPGKVVGAEPRNEPEISKPTKSRTSDSLEAPKTAADLQTAAKPKHQKAASPETKEGRKDRESAGFRSSCSNKTVSGVMDEGVMEERRSSNREPSQDFEKSCSNSKAKVPKFTKRSTADLPSESSSVKPSLKLSVCLKEASVTQKKGKTSSKEGSSTPLTSETLNMEMKQRSSACPKILPSNPKPSKTTSNSGPKLTESITASSGGPSKTFTSDVSVLVTEAGPVHSTSTQPQGTIQTSSSDNKLINVGATFVPNKPSKSLPADEEPTGTFITSEHQRDSCDTSNKDFWEDDGRLKMNLTTKTTNHTEMLNKENPESSESCSFNRLGTFESESITESRASSTSMPTEGPKSIMSVRTTTSKTLEVSDEENREDLAHSVSISAATESLVHQTSKVSGGSNIELKSNTSEAKHDIKSSKARSLVGETETKLRCFSTATTSARKKKDRRGRDDATNADSTSVTSSATVHEFDLSLFHSSPSPPPPPPPPPPSSTPLVPSFSVTSPNSQAVCDHLGPGLHAGAQNLWCVDKPKHHGGVHGLTQQPASSHVTGPPPAQVSERSLIRERSFLSDRCNHGNNNDGVTVTKKKSDIHFPDLRSSVLPERRGKEGKNSKSSRKDQRRDKQSATS